MVQNPPNEFRLTRKGHDGNLHVVGKCQRDKIGINRSNVWEELLEGSLPLASCVNIQNGLVEIQRQKIDSHIVFQVLNDFCDRWLFSGYG